MKDIPAKLAVFIYSIVVSSSLLAGPIINDREWLQPSLTLGFNWYDFNEVCGGGVCTGSIGSGDVQGPDIRGWIWASAEEVGDLFQATTPFQGGVASYASSSFDIVQDFINATGFLPTAETRFLPFYEVVLVGGLTSTLSSSAGFAYGGVIASGFSPFSGDLALNGSRISTRFETRFNEGVGGWLYRPAVSVPNAPTVSLLGPLVLIALRFRRKRFKPANHSSG